jgi:hypothetical protein
MEFLDINFTKDSILLLYTIHSHLLLEILKKTKPYGTLYSSFNNPLGKKIRETRKLEYIHEWHFKERKNEGRKPDKKLKSEKTRVYAQRSRLNMPFKNSISVNFNSIKGSGSITVRIGGFGSGSVQFWIRTVTTVWQRGSSKV